MSTGRALPLAEARRIALGFLAFWAFRVVHRGWLWLPWCRQWLYRLELALLPRAGEWSEMAPVACDGETDGRRCICIVNPCGQGFSEALNEGVARGEWFLGLRGRVLCAEHQDQCVGDDW